MDNPAERLHSILRRVLQASRGGKQVVGEVWAQALGVSFDDKARFLRRLSIVTGLPARILEELKTRDDLDSELFGKWRPQVEGVVGALNFQQNSEWILKHLSDTSMLSLEYCADALKRSTGGVDIETLSRLSEETERMILELQETDIDERVKDYILHRLQQIRVAIDDYTYGDGASLARVAEASIGSCLANREVYATATGKERSVLAKFMSIVRDIVFLVNTAGAALELPERIAEYLPDHGDSVDESISRPEAPESCSEDDEALETGA